MPRHFGYDSHTEGGWTWENHTNSEVSKRLNFLPCYKNLFYLTHDDIIDYILTPFLVDNNQQDRK